MTKKSSAVKKNEFASQRRLDIGKAVRELRESRGLSGVDLCRRSGGLDSKTLTAVEKGRIRNPSILTLEFLAKGFGISVSDIFKKAQMGDERYFCIGNQKGAYKIESSVKGLQIVSFTPMSREFFCGKIIIEAGRGFDESLLGHEGAFFVLGLIGQVEGEIEGKRVLLKEGDSLYARGGMDFCLENPSQRTASLLLVTVPAFMAFGAG